MSNHRREVVVTGMGAVTPFGVGVDALWDGVRSGRSGVDWIRLLPDLDPAIYPVRYAAEVKRFFIDECLKQHCDVRLERSVQMGLVAARGALHQAELLDPSDKLIDSSMRIETIAGSGHGPCHEAEVGHSTFFQRGPAAVRPTTIPKSMFNSLSSNLSIHFGMTGTNLVIASACASGTSAIGLGTILIRHGYADIVLAGGADSPLTRVVFACWTNLRVLARSSEPHKASRPFDRQRNGMVLGEGAGMVVLESRTNADRRGVAPLATVRGYAASSDAFHITAPTVIGQRRAMEGCLADAGLKLEDVDYVNAHGTGTKANDETEAQAIVETFGQRGPDMPVSSTKSMLGHSLGASGAIEFIVCVEAIRHGFVPPTINCDEPDPEVGLDYVPNVGRSHAMRFAMSNSFAFGGNNVTLLVEEAS
jgi:3-oxoacyl-[acyl-carrier-protein] synthase II